MHGALALIKSIQVLFSELSTSYVWSDAWFCMRWVMMILQKHFFPKAIKIL